MHDESSTDMHPMTIPEAARRAGWSTSRMRRHLLAANAATGGRVLENVGRGTQRPRWTVTLAALKILHPNWYTDPEAQERTLDFLAEQLVEERAEREALGRRVSAQHQRLLTLAGVQAGPTLARAR